MKKKEKHQHDWMPEKWTDDLQVYGVKDTEDDEFLKDRGFLLVSCSECEAKGYVMLK